MVRAAIESAIADGALAGQTLLVAVSGGIDSTVLLHALAEVAPRYGLSLIAGHVHHGLRERAADADAEAVRAQAAGLGLPFRIEHVNPGALREDRSNRERPTLQEAARVVRYEALRRQAEASGAAHIATAHNLDDQAETVLMRLLRGTGPDGLGGIAERSADGIVVRPLLAVARVEIERFAEAKGLCWREDESNRSDRYTRNRLRHHWLKGLKEEFNPQLLRAIGRLAEAQRRDAEWIERIVDEATDRLVDPCAPAAAGLRLRRDGWKDLPEALARRVVRRLLIRMGAGRDITRTHILRTLDFLRTGARADGPRILELPGGLRVRSTHEGCTIGRIRKQAEEHATLPPWGEGRVPRR